MIPVELEPTLGRLWREMAFKEGHRKKHPNFDHVVEGRTPAEKKKIIVDFVSDNPWCDSDAVAGILRVTRHNASRELARLCDSGALQRVERRMGASFGVRRYYEYALPGVKSV